MAGKELFSVAVSLLLLITLLVTFPTKHPEYPEQDCARYTGYLAWHAPIKNFNAEINDTLNGFALIFGGIGAHLAVYYTIFRKQPKDTITRFYANTVSTSAKLFNSLLALYTLFSAYASVVYFIFDFGKLWAPIGLAPSLLQAATLVVLLKGGKIESNRPFYYLGVYALVALLLSAFLSWPYDALSFKTQGLVFDLALLFQYGRLLLTTRKQYKDPEAHIPIVQYTVDQSDEDRDGELLPSTIEHPKQLWILVFGSLANVAGRVLLSLQPDVGISFYLFQISQIVVLSLYAFYIYIETNYHSPLQKRYYLPDTSPWKSVVLIIFSIFLSVLVLRTTVANGLA